MVRQSWVASTSAALAAAVAVAALATGCSAGAPATANSASPRPSAAAKPSPKPVIPARVVVAHLRAADGAAITIATFYGDVRYVLHNGSLDPGPLAAHVVRDGPKVTGTERRLLIAGFNGGFKVNAKAGGYEQEGHVIKTLLDGYASLVIDRSGSVRIAVWGHGAPAPGELVYSVRQNLRPLVLAGRPAADVADWQAWGGTVGGVPDVARSGLGENSSGDLIYVASMSASPADIADALVRAGAVIGMELDINPNWVQLDVAARPGAPLRSQVPGQQRPASQFLTGWTRDFIAVLG
jgi:hypothetical protein